MKNKNIYLIAAIAENGAIGYKNTIPWKVKGDLKRFKELTIGNTVIMGRKTYESIGKPLPDRKNIILTRNKNYIAKGCYVVNNIESALTISNNDIYVAGGAEIYKSMMPLCHKLYLTRVNLVPPGDTFFPDINYKNWKLESHEDVGTHEYQNYVRI
jgi:dihydrofolate reductase